MAINIRVVVLLLAYGSVPALAGQADGLSFSASTLDAYYSTTSTTSSNSSSSSHSGSFNNSTSTASSSSASGLSSSGHGGQKLKKREKYIERRGHHGSGSTSACMDSVAVMSVYASAKKYCKGSEWTAAIPEWRTLCESASTTLMDLTTIEANATDAYINSLPIIDPSINTTTTEGTITSPVLLSRSYYNRAYKSYVTHDYALTKDQRYGWGVMGFWGGILFLGMAVKTWQTLTSTRSQALVPDKKPHELLAPVSKLNHIVSTYITTPSVFAPSSKSHVQLFWGFALPTRLDSIIILLFWAVTIIISCVDYQSFGGNISTPSIFQQNWQYSADRTGIVSYACLPWIWLFAGRNNIFLWVTPFDFSTFNMFHRHTAWACTILAVVHSIAYTVIFMVYDGRYNSALVQNYFYMGIVATVVMCVMLPLSITWLRRKWYEIFLIGHILFAILTIYALFRHTSFDDTVYNPYLWPILAIWCFDRTMRFVRLAYCNIHLSFSKDIISLSSAMVNYNKDADLIRIELLPASNTLKAGSGQHYFLYQPNSIFGWENHPFTLGAYGCKQYRPDENAANLDFLPGQPSSTNENSCLIFYIRPYDGWTKRLRDKCLKSEICKIQERILLEGPYGHRAPLFKFDTILMIVGGTGIASAVPYMIEHAERAKVGKTRTTKIHLIWTTRQKAMLDDICSAELATLITRSDVDVTLYCTQKLGLVTTSGDTSESASTKSGSKDAITKLPTVTPGNTGIFTTKQSGLDVLYSRPDIYSMIAHYTEEAIASSSRLAVLSCGPGRMADDCRDAIYKVKKDGWQDVEYFEEAFAW